MVSGKGSSAAEPDERQTRIAEALEHIAALRLGGTDYPDEEAFADYPELLPELRVQLGYLQRVQRLWKEVESDLSQMTVVINRPTIRDVAAPLEADSIRGYRILHEIHRGGQGVVYKAIQESTQRVVAVKVLLEGPFAGDRSRWRFEREVRLVARLKHPHIVAIHDSGIAQGRHYFAMDYVAGRPLNEHVLLAGLSVRDTLRLFVTVCEAVSYAHRRGIIHRDLKPSNILVGEDGSPQVLDFGLAKVLGPDLDESLRSLTTMPGHILGTVRYMSPEQTRGELESVDTRTDVYALGVILYELLIGLPPYPTDRDVLEAFRNIRETDPPRPSRIRRDLPGDLDAIILKSMQKEPDRRYSSAAEFQQDLAAWLDNRPVSARSDSSFYVLRKLAVRHYFHTSVIFALLAAIVGFGSISFHALLGERDAREDLEVINRQFAADNQNLAAAVDIARANNNQHALGWFLMEWHADRLPAARAVQALVDPSSPEYAAMVFLLDESSTPEQLQTRLPPSAASLVLFITGERHLKAGRAAEARRSFERYARLYERSAWIPLVENRLQQLAGSPSTAGQ